MCTIYFNLSLTNNLKKKKNIGNNPIWTNPDRNILVKRMEFEIFFEKHIYILEVVIN